MKNEEPYSYVNKFPKYAIVDENGKVLKKFRVKATALQMFSYYKAKFSPAKVKIVEI